MLDLVTALEAERPTDRIANIWKRGGALRPQTRPPVEPLEQLPFLARDLLDETRGVIHMATQRGCPFPCTYCAARMYNELYEQVGGEYGRRRPVEDVVAELQGLRAKGDLSYVIFLDDTFTIHHPWVRRFCELYPAQVGIPFSLHARVETVSEPMLYQLRAAGCDQVTYGVESGSERVRREIMKRPVTNQRFRDVFRWTREAGIRLTANFMLGLPGETKAELAETLQLAEELEVADFGYFVFYPYPGTALFRVCREEGYLPADYLERPANHRASILQLPGLTNEDIAAVYDGFTALRRRLFRARYGVELPEDSPATEHVELLAATG
jgi:anaerobic magnesium-protoporphyrin IX monomethyl ester cyclase